MRRRGGTLFITTSIYKGGKMISNSIESTDRHLKCKTQSKIASNTEPSPFHVFIYWKWRGVRSTRTYTRTHTWLMCSASALMARCSKWQMTLQNIQQHFYFIVHTSRNIATATMTMYFSLPDVWWPHHCAWRCVFALRQSPLINIKCHYRVYWISPISEIRS